MNNTKYRIKPIDSLRGIAALGIAFFWHYGHFNAASHPIKFGGWLKNEGWILVDLFFVLSGFIFVHVYKEKIIDKSIDFRTYIINRLSRLYPLHIITLIIACIGQILYKSMNDSFFIHQNNNVFHFILNIFCLHSGMFENGGSFNWSSWSIATELIGYLLFFYILWKYGYKKSYYIIAYIVILLIGLTIQKQNLNLVLFNYNTSRLLIGFFIGTLLYELNKYIESSKDKNKILVFVTVLFAIYITLTDRVGYSVIGNPVTYTLFVFPVIILLILNIKILHQLFSTKLLTFLGDISFSVYMLHFPIQLFIKIIDQKFELMLNYSNPLFFMFYLGVVVLLSTLSYYLIEKNIMNKLRVKYITMPN